MGTIIILSNMMIWVACIVRFIIAITQRDGAQVVLFASLLVIDLNVCAILYHLIGIKRY